MGAEPEKQLDVTSAEDGRGTDYTLRHFPGEPYRLLKPISVRIRRLGNKDFLASFNDANIAISGDSAQQAFQNLAGHLLDVFEILEQEETTLGPEPARQVGVLREYIAREE